jgi:hypothetical protein
MCPHEPLRVVVELAVVQQDELHATATVTGQPQRRGAGLDVHLLDERALLGAHADRVTARAGRAKRPE